MQSWSRFLEGVDTMSILADIHNPHSQKSLEDILNQHPDWVAGIMQFKQTNPEQYMLSMREFENNTPKEYQIQKLATGKRLSYYDFM